MIKTMRMNTRGLITSFVLSALVITNACGPGFAQMPLGVGLPPQPVALSPYYEPPLLKGIRLDPRDPLKLDFILDPGDGAPAQGLLRYFLGGLTIPQGDLWVRLSAYEKDRMISEALESTRMGKVLLAQEYLLKQLTATLLSPASAVGRNFWDDVYRQTHIKYGVTEILTGALNNIWIVPSRPVIEIKNGVACVSRARLKVLLESDYMKRPAAQGNVPAPDGLEQIFRDTVIPVIEKEINEGRNFASLRQVYYALILAGWMKSEILSSANGRIIVDDESRKMQKAYMEALTRGVEVLMRKTDGSTYPSAAEGFLLPNNGEMERSSGGGIDLNTALTPEVYGDSPRLMLNTAAGVSIDRGQVISFEPVLISMDPVDTLW